MSQVTLYHNPNCSKSRAALDILTASKTAFKVVEYLKAPPSRADLEAIIAALDIAPIELVRQDKHFQELALNPDDYPTSQAVIELLLAHPRLLQRPIVTRGTRAVIGRPPEDIHQLLA